MPQNRALRGREVALVLGILAATLVAYAPVRHNGWVSFDDPRYVVASPEVRAGLTAAGVRWALTSIHAYNWHPLTWLSHMLDVELFGLDLGRHHLVSVGMHAATASLLFLLLHLATGELWRSGFVAALFALHPAHVESVAWLSERKDVLSALLFVLVLLAWVRYARRPGKARYRLVLGLFVLGLLAKPMLVTGPFILLLLDYWPLGRLALPAGWRPEPQGEQKKKRKDMARGNVPLSGLLLEKVPFLALAAVSSALTVVAQRPIVQTLELYPFEARLANALLSYVGYLGKLLWPVPLAVFYPHAEDALASPRVGLAAALLVGLTVLALACYRRGYPPVGWLWYLGMLVPVIGLVQVGIQSMADRYTYLPSIGLSVALTWGLGDLARRWRWARVVLGALAVATLLACAVLTRAQVRTWQNDLTLFGHAARVTEESFWAHYNYGQALMRAERNAEALHQFREALRIDPEDAESMRNAGALLAEAGRLEEALPLFERAVKLRPGDWYALRDLGNAYLKRGELPKAGETLRRGLEIAPDDPELHFLLGSARAQSGDLGGAREHLGRSLELRPDHAEAHNAMGVVYAREARMAEALAHFERALVLRPDYPEALRNLQAARARLQAP